MRHTEVSIIRSHADMQIQTVSPNDKLKGTCAWAVFPIGYEVPRLRDHDHCVSRFPALGIFQPEHHILPLT